MNREQFENRNSARWQEYEKMVETLEAKKIPEDVQKLPGLFRQLCADLSLAENRAYGLGLTERLNELVIRGYRFIYRNVGGGFHAVMRFFLSSFPCALRSEAKLFWLCMAVFWLPAVGFLLAASFAPEWIEVLLGPDAMDSMQSMYGEDANLKDARGEFGSDFMMFGFYIMNNISIAFRTFASGIFFGIGTMFVLGYNGLYIGAVMGYVHYALDKEKFYSFVSTHSSWELLGIVISAVAGMRLGLAVLHPGRNTRRGSLVIAGKKSITLLYGAAFMIFVAAIFEGFVSAGSLPPRAKYTIGLGFWAMFAFYFMLCGRNSVATVDSEPE
ncbi:MAG: putative membrane protein SpoIIM required for sporulation [Verrucomicrobiales bacterium]